MNFKSVQSKMIVIYEQEIFPALKKKLLQMSSSSSLFFILCVMIFLSAFGRKKNLKLHDDLPESELSKGKWAEHP